MGSFNLFDMNCFFKLDSQHFCSSLKALFVIKNNRITVKYVSKVSNLPNDDNDVITNPRCGCISSKLCK